ncbi:30S ribosomal protein S13 [Candidatus Campbellbacteria bacterium CG11_big_fil_rev_8_21_14_0_20_44_21]|uniref:Small ribosomal subunit protein uS13 n=1 Tax=Candidatus Campbellbacteria bacterium CG22_combo_CG10-13_8_21_14_all_43_18 TaxID=1974530 RepID=A0A2H0DX36_9BACT|nr:MAG: 30S ribosomal protein S13 [Candidatus Campbellbacteria bacterium CG22_combo_CG10-13_8_21_14_all_43_18]PIR24437.1 MAG: 30S ribosomal protein S13 [Candidatus Campbellbacteria bacterium CG11_big_fil_rev_8_21_14_0_20_44_21]
MRIAGITIPDNKRLEIGLSSVYGIGRPLAKKILDKAGIPLGKKGKEVTPAEENKIREMIENSIKVEGDLKREIAGNIKRLKDIESYRGIRHSKNLPVRGQRTKSNARTRKGPRKTMGSGKVKVEKK